MKPLLEHAPQPVLDDRVDAFLTEVIGAPPGHKFILHNGRLLFPCYGTDQWRLLMEDEEGVSKPVFLEGEFLRKLSRAIRYTRQIVMETSQEIAPKRTKDARVS